MANIFGEALAGAVRSEADLVDGRTATIQWANRVEHSGRPVLCLHRLGWHSRSRVHSCGGSVVIPSSA